MTISSFEITAIVVAGILAIPLLWWVHCGLERHYVRLARRFCIKRGLTPIRWNCGPAFDDTGVKTEFSIVEFDCDHLNEGRKYVRLLVWIFGVRKVLIVEPYLEKHNNETNEERGRSLTLGK